jgi:AAA15 family ATPase/GTPase
MLTRLEISGYRGFRQAEVEGLSRVNLFIGPNGSGKSTLLESILILGQGYHQSDPLNVGRLVWIHERRNELQQRFDSWWHARNYSAAITIGGKLHGRDVKVTLSRALNQLPQWSVTPKLGDLQGASLVFLTKLLPLDAKRALERKVEEVLWKEAFLQGAHNTVAQLFENIYGIKIRNITFTQDNEILVDVAPRPLRLDDLGSGMRIAFRVLLAALMTGGSALLLEEFDAYQYKTSLENLAVALCDIADQQKMQLFLTTHSLESVHSFLKAAASRDNDWIKVFPLSLSAQGVLSTRGMPRTDAENLLSAGLDLRDLTSYAK